MKAYLTRENLLAAAFFLAPFCLLAGRAAQVIGMYLFLVLTPLFLRISFSKSEKLILLGLCMLGLYSLFPLADLLQVAMETAAVGEVGVSGSKIIRSQFSSALGSTAVMIIIVRFFAGDRTPSNRNELVGKFELGFLWASLLLGVYLFVQFFTGFNFTEVASYRPDRIMGGGFTRVSGFTNHPVTFCGMSLAVFGYFGGAYGQTFRRIPGIIAGLYFIFIWMSGSRYGAVCSVVMAGLWVLSYLRRPVIFKLAVVGGLGLLAGLLVFATGLHTRFAEIADSGLGDRAHFWKVHWTLFLESPWFGNGHYFLEEYWRPLYFEKLGLGSLEHKYNAHNIYLELLADLGVFGVFALSALLVVLGKQLRALGGHLSPIAWAIGGVALFGLMQNSFFDTPTLLICLSFVWVSLWSIPRDS